MQVEGKGKVVVDTSHDKVKILNDVQFVSDLGFNFLSFRQLMTNIYSLWFDDDTSVIITLKKSRKKVTSSWPRTIYFHWEFLTWKFSLAASLKDELKLWHLRYVYLNIKGLMLPGDKGIVLWISKLILSKCVIN